MFSKVRAAGFAAAALLFGAAALWGGPVMAYGGNVAPLANYYLDHAAAPEMLSELGLNDAEAPAGAAGNSVEAFAFHLGQGVDVALPESRDIEALVASFATGETRGAQEDCLANAVYFEARGEPLEGQLAVAEVVLNRAASGRYPSTICGVVVQPAQFSFVRRGTIPRADRASESWRRAVAIARIAAQRETRMLPNDVLWYHANHVSPGWGRRLAQNSRIGAHIFYR